MRNYNGYIRYIVVAMVGVISVALTLASEENDMGQMVWQSIVRHVWSDWLALTLPLAVSTLAMAFVLAFVAAMFSSDKHSLWRWFENILRGVANFCNIFRP